MRVLGICGSQREGNTEFYTKSVLDQLSAQGHETVYMPLRLLDIRGCEGCYGCVKAGKCVIEDDFQVVFNHMVEADALIVGSPVYNGSITSKLKALLDRAGFSARWMKNTLSTEDGQYKWGKMVFSRKLFAPITVARKTGHTFALAQLTLWAQVNDFITVGSNYWTVGHAGTGGAVDACNDAEGAAIMSHLGDNIDFLLKRIKE